jgi:hypothetical protein
MNHKNTAKPLAISSGPGSKGTFLRTPPQLA